MQVKVPTLFLLGAQDRRVPVSNGFQVSLQNSSRKSSGKCKIIGERMCINANAVSEIDLLP